MTSNSALRIDVASIPDFRRLELAKGALALTEQAFSMPGAEERYQRWKAERAKKGDRPLNLGSVLELEPDPRCCSEGLPDFLPFFHREFPRVQPFVQ